MDYLRGKLTVLKLIYENKMDIQDILSVRCALILGKWRLWFTTSTLMKSTRFNIFLNNTMTILSSAFIANALSYQLMHSNEIPIDILVLKINHIMMLFIGLNMIQISRKYRPEYSQVIEFVNHKNWKALERKDFLKFRPLRNRIFLMGLGIMSAMGMGAIITPLPYLLETWNTGKLYFGLVLPFDDIPHTLSVYIQCGIQLLIIYWMLSFGILFLVVIFDPILQLAINFKTLAADMSNLRNGCTFREEEEILQLIRLAGESIEMNEFVAMVNQINSQFFVRFIFLSFTLVGLLVGVFITVDPSWHNIMYLGYPINCFAMTSILCFLGQYLEDSAASMEVAIYECDWHSAPISFRKMLLMLLLRCKTPIVIHARPFYKLNLAQLAQITKSIYIMITIARRLFVNHTE